jgi:hypothetical protein
MSIVDEPDRKDSYSVKEFCERNSISRAFFYLLLKRGAGPKISKRGSRTLISREAAAEWRRAQDTAPTTATESAA